MCVRIFYSHPRGNIKHIDVIKIGMWVLIFFHIKYSLYKLIMSFFVMSIISTTILINKIKLNVLFGVVQFGFSEFSFL